MLLLTSSLPGEASPAVRVVNVLASVVHRPLLGVSEDGVGLSQLLEFLLVFGLFGGAGARVPVWGGAGGC